MANVDDIHSLDKAFSAALSNVRESSRMSIRSKNLVLKLVNEDKEKGVKKSTLVATLTLPKKMAEFFGPRKDIDKLSGKDFSRFLSAIEEEGLTDFNYRKWVKKFYKWLDEDNIPKWVKQVKIIRNKTVIQPSDLLTKEELDKLLSACTHPRDKALIAMAMDSGMRAGALGTLRVKNVEFNAYGALLHISKTSMNLKTTPPKAIPISWSTGYLNKWLDVHPRRNEPDAPLWLNFTGRNKHEAMSYHAMWQMLKDLSKTAGISKGARLHLLRHHKIVDMMLKGFSDQQIKFQAGWDKDSKQLSVYGNFSDKDMIKSIYKQAGLELEADKKMVTLKQCPRCHTVLVPEARMCHQCALILDASLDKERQAIEDDVAEKALLKLMENPKVMAMFKEMVNK